MLKSDPRFQILVDVAIEECGWIDRETAERVVYRILITAAKLDKPEPPDFRGAVRRMLENARKK